MNDAPTPIDVGATGDIDMLPDPTFRAIQRIFQAGTKFGAVWPGLRDAINGDEQIVKPATDEVSMAFRAGYNLYEAAVKPQAERVKPDLHSAGTTGNSIVAMYLELSHQIQPAYMRALE
jgi:hypothetical protein